VFEYKEVVIHFGEIWLKGRNRTFFVNALHRNIRDALSGESYDSLEDMRDRFMLHLNEKSSMRSILDKLGHVFGISWFAPVAVVKNSISDIAECAKLIVEPGSTVRIVAHRSLKSVDFSSKDIVDSLLGRAKRLKFELDKKARKRLYVNVTGKGSLLYVRRIAGLGGLPVGTSGKAVILLSGGIDSPVASFYAMKRGLAPIYAHVHAFQSNDDARLSKIDELTGALSRYYGKASVYILPGYVFQSFAAGAPSRYGNLLFKLFLYRLAGSIAKSEKASCIVTGESLGQVASQTAANLNATTHGIEPFIMRPLIGMDKQEIVNIAKRLGTFELSIRKYKDVCQTNSRNTVLLSDAKELRAAYKDAKLGTALRMTMKKAKRVTLDR
jgi:thiamine biosynthesis protein ThiI